MATLSTHVLDTSRGRPAAGVRVSLVAPDGARAEGVTDDDGRIGSLGRIGPGEHRLAFAVAAYFEGQGVASFYPEVTVVFTAGEDEHYHVPLLLNPFGYSTYRGS